MEKEVKKDDKLVDFRSGWKDEAGKTTPDAPPPEIPGQDVQLMVPKAIEEAFEKEMRKTVFVMNQSFIASMQIVEGSIPSALSLMNPAVAESMKFQAASILAGKIFESMEGMVAKIDFEPVVPAKK